MRRMSLAVPVRILNVREQPDQATHRPHPRSSKYLLYQCPVIYAMGSNVDTYFPVQRIAQACLQCRYAIVTPPFWPAAGEATDS